MSIARGMACQYAWGIYGDIRRMWAYRGGGAIVRVVRLASYGMGCCGSLAIGSTLRESCVRHFVRYGYYINDPLKGVKRRFDGGGVR